MEKKFYSNGKLLLSSEYLVLDGAQALALPTKFGQSLEVKEDFGNCISWKSYDVDGEIWFEDTFFVEDVFAKNVTEEDNVRNTLIAILHHASLMNAGFLDKNKGYTVTTNLTFNRKWGLGTSSTLINNIAQWANVDAFVLLQNSFGGSGYDIACAMNDLPVVYQLVNGLPVVKTVSFFPKFHQNLYFVYLNKKQNSRSAIAAYHAQKHQNLNLWIDKFNKFTNAILEANNLATFANLISKHEANLSMLLQTSTISELCFSDFEGQIKSLGAWGGDFVLAISKDDPTDYFAQKGFDIVIPYQKMILGS